MKRYSVMYLAFFTVLAATVLPQTSVAAAADGQAQPTPTTENQTDGAFDIQVVTRAGRIRVQVINKQTGLRIDNARVLMRHWSMATRKGAFPSRPGFTVLEPDGLGGYVCPREHVGHGEQISIRAQVPGADGEVKTSLVVDN
jgi:hypothetical protein